MQSVALAPAVQLMASRIKPARIEAPPEAQLEANALRKTPIPISSNADRRSALVVFMCMLSQPQRAQVKAPA
jgi:hypothetical protein